MKSVIVDTGVWYACFDKTDSHYNCSDNILRVLRESKIIIPFPTLYETINTRFAKNTHGQMGGLERFVNNPQSVQIVDDTKYKKEALDLVFRNVEQKKGYSLVDMIIRLMMEDVSLGELNVLTFNRKDFLDLGQDRVFDPNDL